MVVADFDNNRIRMVAPDGTVTTLAGSGTVGYLDGPGASAMFNGPEGVAVMQNGSVVVSEWGHRIRLVAPDGTVTTLAGTGVWGSTDGPGNNATFARPSGMDVLPNGSIVIAEYSTHRIRMVSPDGTVSTLTGTTQGHVDGPRATAKLNSPFNVAVMPNGSLIVSEWSQRIRLVAPDGTITTVAGNGTEGFLDGPAATAQFAYPRAATVLKSSHRSGYIVVADQGNQKLRLIGPDGIVSTLVGSSSGWTDGPKATAKFDQPTDVKELPNGNIVVVDSNNREIRLLNFANTPCTIAWNCNSHASSVSGNVVDGCTCTCSTGYTGAACSSCATDYTGYPTCAPTPCSIGVNCNGVASSVSGTLVSGCTCTCSTGYAGAACSSCATYYSGYPTCTPTPCSIGVNCNGLASSVNGTLVSGCTCTCSTGYAGAACSSCATYYTGYPTCTPTACSIGVDCNGHASSVNGTLVSGCTCTCSTGYAGAACSSCATYYTGYPTCTPTACSIGVDCNGHASSVNGTLVSGCTCTCSAGYAGAACSSCAPNYSGYPSCTPTACSSDVNCNGHACSANGTLVSGCTCTCSTGYTGAACSSCAPNYTGYPACTPTACSIDVNCNGHASSANGTLVSGCTCTCSIGFSGAACSSCATDYTGYPTCAPTACSVAVDCDGHACSANGTLVSGCSCTCSTGYTGAACSSCATNYTGYPTCTPMCGRNVTLLSYPPAVSLLSLSLSKDDSVVAMVLSAKSINSVVVVYQKGVAQAVSSGFLSGVSKNDFNSYATCATMPEGISVAADGTGAVTYSHAVNYTLCEQNVTDDYLVISCAFEVEHYVWLSLGLSSVMTATEVPVVVRVPRTVEQTIEAERFTFQIFPGLLVATARNTTYAIRCFTLVESSSWIASSSMCMTSTDRLSFSCILDPMTVAGEHRADFRVVFVNDEASSVGILVSVRTYYIGKYTPNIFGRSVALHFTPTDLHYGPSEALVFLYGPNNTAVFFFSTQLSALLLVNAAGESISVMDESAFNLTCSNVPAANLTQCSFLPAAVHVINPQFDAINPNLTLRGTFSFESLSKRRDTEDVLVASGLTIDEETSASGRSGSSNGSSRTALIAAVPVACGAGLLLVVGALAYVVMRRRAAVEPAEKLPARMLCCLR